MPTTKKTVPVPQETKPEINNHVLDLLKEMSESMKTINARLEKVETLTKPKVEASPSSQVVFKSEEEKFPIPREYLEIINNILNQEFGIKVEPFADKPAFLFTIIVPEKYSALTPKEKEIIKADLRSKVISYAEGSNGVKAWAEKVYSNFAHDIQTVINMERKAISHML